MSNALKFVHRIGLMSLVLGCSVAAAEPGIVYELGGKFDKSFNEAAYRGVERWSKETGQRVAEFEVFAETQREQALRRMAERGTNPVIAIGFSQQSAVAKVAKDFPGKRFVIIDEVVPLPNVQSILFKENEGSYLVGALAALSSKSGKIGFVGGMDVPLIRKFQCGYEQGAKFVNPGVEVMASMTGTTGAAWNDPARGGELARAQFARGVDVVFAAAGGTGTGVYQAAKDARKLAIGVDSNQNYMQPGTMLTSMIKRVDEAVYQALVTTRTGLSVMGLKEGGVDYALDKYNAALISSEMTKKVETIKADIISGRVKVPDYVNGVCK
ncbi:MULTISPECIES: BMP family lipoprotein [Uliginosibacterium]|uniref:BMP family ABC transporter substrate-binding protein n=1 Tax=Uliginosibacterium aquaticum TaxID=2731212 RepID=A0ABX2IQA5_9RHOO|nr:MULTISPECIES: BMP family ABC transporter substrate-binding protein [Uliginosibacterium]MDO6387699.1 BMP family ABC transporter substrate-binding protein [Uliginosibacterium sp. 31-12]NSL56325.1 BMP family ABC transporter substrate-binding protein [Uliginosibacterium aquaticum]PLK48003.1 BMP family ABC transporter substrate-binding protein [Uliginosibacterium sp. TH139]